MKKYLRIVFLLLLVAIMLVITCACSGSSKTPNTSDDVSDTPENGNNDPSNTETPEQTPEDKLDDSDFDSVWPEEYRKDDVAPRPDFTEAEIEAQMAAGAKLVEEIKAKAADLSCSSYTIPAGDYGFTYTTNTVNAVPSALWLDGIKRPDDNPFTINAEGVNFWFTTLGKPMGNIVRNLHLTNCENIIFNGLTIDSYTADNIEGSVTRIDVVNNRIAIKLYPGTMALDDATIAVIESGSDFRMIPIKANGDAIAPLYNVDNTWGPGAHLLKDICATGNEDEYWITFRNDILLNTIYTEKWRSTYGAQGTLEVGDGVSILFAVQLLSVDNCKQITFEGLNYYVTKGGFWENGGYGNHLWKDCYMGPRPGTSQILGAEGNMSQGLRHGSTYDNVTIGFTTDDAINIHGFWSSFNNIDNKVCTLSSAPVGIAKGDIAEVIDGNGKIVATLTVAKDPTPSYNYNGFLSSAIEFEEDVPTDYSSFKLRWPASECDGWVIKNCRWENVYQRILINSGSGTFENNKVMHMGMNFMMASSTLGTYEGGVLGNITIKNNVFINSSNHPGAMVFSLSQTSELGNTFKSGKITITDNVFVKCGMMLSANNISALDFSRNTIVDPLIYGKESLKFNRLIGDVSGIDKVTMKQNSVYGLGYEQSKTGSNITEGISTELVNKIFEFCDHSTKSATDIKTVVDNRIKGEL